MESLEKSIFQLFFFFFFFLKSRPGFFFRNPTFSENHSRSGRWEGLEPYTEAQMGKKSILGGQRDPWGCPCRFLFALSALQCRAMQGGVGDADMAGPKITEAWGGPLRIWQNRPTSRDFCCFRTKSGISQHWRPNKVNKS